MRGSFEFPLLFLNFLFTLPFFSLATAQDKENGGITLNHVWARATPAGSNVDVAYVQIRTKKESPDTLLSVSSPVATKVEIYTHTYEDGILKLRHPERLSFLGKKKSSLNHLVFVTC